MRVLVTGGAGFIGSNFVRHFLEKHPGDEVAVLDALTYAGNLDSLNDLKGPRFTFIKGDVRDEKSVDKAMKGCEEVVHFAAETHVDRSIVDPAPFISTDVVGTGVMLKVASAHGIKKFVHISTDEVYGTIDKGTFRETDPLAPRNPYSASKAAAEMLARSFFTTYGFPAVITRSSNNYGPYQHPEKLIPRFITNLLNGKKVPVYGEGRQIRDWLYVKDNCEAIDVVRQRGKPGEAYNIGGECEKPNIEVTRTILKLLGKGEEMIEHVEDRKGHDFRYALSNDKIRKLGWAPSTPFGEGLKNTVEWYVKNEWWWKPLLKGS